MQPNYYQEYIDGASAALWATAWADWQEELDSADERSVNLSGQEITDLMPPIPNCVRVEGAMMIGTIRQAIGSHHFYSLFQEIGKTKYEVGWYLTMRVMGHGVSLCDDCPGLRFDEVRDVCKQLPYYENPFGGFYDVADLVEVTA